jgi:RimJ/RimL family protein N-acetyltransferase/uncharacterized glyoxalase superfamily protein PhnB
MKAPPKIETARLVLSRPERSDTETIFERYAGDPDVTRFLGWPRHRSVADTQAFLAFSAEEWERWPAGPYLIWSREDGRLLGSTGFGFEAPTDAVTGYVLAKDGWGKGYATEALTAIVDAARHIGVRRLRAFCHPDHRPSWRVLEKCGFVRDRGWSRQVEFPNLAPGVPQDVACYEMVFEANACMAVTRAIPALRVADVARSIEWYHGTLGFAGDPFPAMPPYEFAILRHGQAEVMLRRGSPPRRSELRQYDWDVYLRLEGSRFRELFAVLSARGIVTRRLERMFYGLAEFEMTDPDGYVICLSQLLEDASDLPTPAA